MGQVLFYLRGQLYASSLCQPLHTPCNLLVRDLNIDLRAGDGGVSHHLGDAFHRNTCF